MTIFGDDLKIMGNSLDCNMMPTKTSESLFKKNSFNQVLLSAGHL